MKFYINPNVKKTRDPPRVKIKLCLTFIEIYFEITILKKKLLGL